MPDQPDPEVPRLKKVEVWEVDPFYHIECSHFGNLDDALDELCDEAASVLQNPKMRVYGTEKEAISVRDFCLMQIRQRRASRPVHVLVSRWALLGRPTERDVRVSDAIRTLPSE